VKGDKMLIKTITLRTAHAPNGINNNNNSKETQLSYTSHTRTTLSSVTTNNYSELIT